MKLKRLFRLFLLLLPISMITWQIYASNFQNLTRWKGSGYGMYTDSHGAYRAIVYRLKDTDTLLQVFPLKQETYCQLSTDDQSLYSNSKRALKVGSFYPEWYEHDLKKNPWVARFLDQEGNLEIHRTDLDIDSKEARSVVVYCYE